MTGPMGTSPAIDKLDAGPQVTTIHVSGWPLNQGFEWWLRKTNRMVIGQIMGRAQRSIWQDRERREQEATADNTDPFTKAVGFLPFGYEASRHVDTATVGGDISYEALAEELAGRVLSRYVKGSNWAFRAAAIAEQLFDHGQHGLEPPVPFVEVEERTAGYYRNEQGMWTRYTRTVEVPVYDPDNYDLDNYDFSGWVELFPKFRNDIGFPITVPPYYEGLPDLYTPTLIPEPIPSTGPADGLQWWEKPGVGNLILHPNDYWIIETWVNDFGGGPTRGTNWVIHRSTEYTPDPTWIGPTESQAVVQLTFVDDSPISPGRVRRVGRTVKPSPTTPLRLPERQREHLRVRGLQFTVSTDGAVPSAVTAPTVVVSRVTEPPASTFSKTRARVRERKVRPMKKMAGIIFWAVNGVTESIDAIRAFWGALPNEVRSGYVLRVNRKGEAYYKRIYAPTPFEMARDLYRHWDRVDFNRALWNVTANQVQDHVIGRSHGALTKASRPHLEQHGRPVGLAAGPAM